MKSRKSLRPLVLLNRPASGVILRRDASLGQGVEQGRFPDVGETDDATLQTHENILRNQCTIEPNVGIVEVPDARMARNREDQGNPR